MTWIRACSVNLHQLMRRPLLSAVAASHDSLDNDWKRAQSILNSIAPTPQPYRIQNSPIMPEPWSLGTSSFNRAKY